MRVCWTTWLAISLWTTSMLLLGCILGLLYANGGFVHGVLAPGLVLYVPAIGSLATTGALLAAHRPTNPIGWIFLIAVQGYPIVLISSFYAEYITETSPGSLPELTLLFWIGAWSYISIHVPPIFGALLFPTGRLPSRGWRLFAWIAAGGLALLVVAEMFSPGILDSTGEYPQFTNPVGYEPLGGVLTFLSGSFAELMPMFLLTGAVISIFVRMRQATDTERLQIKWFAYAVTIPLVGITIYLLLLAFAPVSSSSTSNIGEILFTLGLTTLPIAIAIAILRHNLYDIDRLINRTVVYGSLTALLLLCFLGSVIFFQFLLDPITAGNDLAVAGSTLLVAALFRPMRNRLQRFVDRRFYRHNYDARQTLQTFAITARDAVHLEELTGGLADVVSSTVQPEHLSIWFNQPEEVRENTQ